jgi:hypothetical protein
MGILVVPSILTVMDDSVEYSVFYDFSEEEEESKNTEVFELFLQQCNKMLVLETYVVTDFSLLNNKAYVTPELNLPYPPPKQ